MRVIGMMWNKNEADILPQIISAAIPKVDKLYMADDGSSDASYEIMKHFQKLHPKVVVSIQQNPDKSDQGQRRALLAKIQEDYTEDDWIQLIESDIMLLDTHPATAIVQHSIDKIAVPWHTLNAVRRDWSKSIDTYPYWAIPLQELMPYGHWMEVMIYSFRNLKGLSYSQSVWRPWPAGFGAYTKNALGNAKRTENAPLLAHYGFRGPTHFNVKYKSHGKYHRRYNKWRVDDIEEIKKTVSFFNGDWNSKGTMEMSRKGWIKWINSR